jgi:2-C-methyl-D-erythritol 4-phosphate cytidylyltransferase
VSAPRTAAVVLGAGSGQRVGADRNKVLLELGGVPVLARSVRTVLDVRGVHRVVVVCRPGEQELVSDALAPHLGTHDVWLVDGGESRHESEWRALQALAPDIEAGEIDVVAVHDAARPLAPAGLWADVVAAAAEHGGALPVVEVPQLSHRDGRRVDAGLVAVQTPQAFDARTLLSAYTSAERDGFTGTDTASCLERYSDVVVVGVPSSASNLKVTFPEDVALAEALLSRAPR